jgi:hypothetical protein
MREIFTSGSVGRAPGNRRLYPETLTHIPLRVICAVICVVMLLEWRELLWGEKLC